MRGDFRGRWGWWRLAGTAALAALMASTGCSNEPDADNAGDTDPRPGKTTPTEERAEATESADEERDPGDPAGQAEADKLTPPDEPEPVIDLTGPVEEIERIYREQRAYRSWLFSHPDPRNTERLARITHRDCPCWRVDHELLTRYAEHKRWWTGADESIQDVQLMEQPTADLVKLHITWQRDSTEKLIDETGRLHSQLPPARGVQEVLIRRGTFDPSQPTRDRSGDPWKVIIEDDLKYEELAQAKEHK